MTTIGDGFLIAFTFIGLFVTAWATSITIMLLFPNVADRARVAASERTAKAFGLGLLLLFTLGVLGLSALSNPLPLVKLSGWLLTLGLLAVAAIGTAGISQAAGYRLRELDETLPMTHAMARGAAFVIGATILPLLGWLFVGPVLLVTSLGAGWKALRPLSLRKRQPGVV